ncbi:hypothetical protein GCM10007886_25980 [Methylobacterium gregans]|uniref:hypothetical protein n=1 Tax=Methylobacterium gregans TaxID=374424 RepID=UPI001EE2E7EA|nr:hypothetical protein [Methylobacterium gregans]MDQ0521251.1 hypothetical protein [Methylobacterium gregans]GLS54415.1 hypothetical protein GCM10007886_25980 [Methylobacterium gregans]
MAGNIRRIAVTEGYGKAGKTLVPYLTAEGYGVFVIDCDPPSDLDELAMVADLTDVVRTLDAPSSAGEDMHVLLAGLPGGGLQRARSGPERSGASVRAVRTDVDDGAAVEALAEATSADVPPGHRTNPNLQGRNATSRGGRKTRGRNGHVQGDLRWRP